MNVASADVNEPSTTLQNGTVSLEPEQSPAPPSWPSDIHYISTSVISPYLTTPQLKWLRQKPAEGNEQPNSQNIPRISLPVSRAETDAQVTIRTISDQSHPAHGQRGLFATRDLAPGEYILPYIGYVHSSTASELAQKMSGDALSDLFHMSINEHAQKAKPLQIDALPDSHTTHELEIATWDSSSYDLNLCREPVELAIDASLMGNEARFCNDYRGVPASHHAKTPVGKTEKLHQMSEMAIPNAEFRDVWFDLPYPEPDPSDEAKHEASVSNEKTSKSAAARAKQERRNARRRKQGMRGVGIFVLPAGRAGKRKDGIRAGQEVLVSYGKGFWAHHA